LYSTAKENTENFNFNNRFKSLFLDEKEEKLEGAYQRAFDLAIDELNEKTFDFITMKSHFEDNEKLLKIHKIMGEMMLDLNYWSAIETHRYSNHWKKCDIKLGHYDTSAQMKFTKKSHHSILSKLA